MASIQERRNKDGTITSFTIKVHRGRDASGKQLKPYTTSYKPPASWNEDRARKEAEKQAVLFEKQCKDGLVSSNKQTFEKYSAYVMRLKKKNNKLRTVERYEELLQRILPAIGHIQLSDIKPQHLNQFYDNLGEDGQNKKTGGKLSNKTILEHHRLISTIMTQAEKEMLIPFNPARRATPPRAKKQQANHFQIDETNRIIDCLDSEPLKWKVITYLLIVTGCRRGEILGLRWSKVNFNTGTIRIESTLLKSKEIGIYEDTTKTDRTRILKLSPEMMKLLREYKVWYLEQRLLNGDRWQFESKWKGSDFVFVQETGEPMHPDSPTNWLAKFSKRHDLPHVNPHAFRHTYASILISKGIDIVTVSKTLGHEKPSTTTDMYAELMQQASDQASECIADAVLRRTR